MTVSPLVNTLSAHTAGMGKPGLPLGESLNRYGFGIDTTTSTGTGVARHTHPGLELVLVHNGAVTVSVNNWIGVLTPGNAVLFDATQIHGIRHIAGPYLRTVLHFRKELLDEPNSGLLWETSVPTIFPYEIDSGMQAVQSLLGLQELCRNERSLGNQKALFAEIIRLLVRQQISKSIHGAGCRVTPIVSRSLQYMVSNLQSPSTLAKLTEENSVSQGYLCYLFKIWFGCTPQRVWQQLRIEHACNALVQTGNIDDAAEAASFATRRGFERAFQSITGVSPGTYRDTVAPHVAFACSRSGASWN